jgi:tRNA pseudouridine38-40 synthase
MPRYALKIEYNGAPFFGWQRQKEHVSVQGAIEHALAQFAPEAPLVQGAGRTDAGVHATGQIAHLDLLRDWEPFRLSEALNFHLRDNPVSILAAARVDDDFHARFGALEREYLYRLISRRAPMTHDAGLVWHMKYRLDLEAMRHAATHLIGNHDFTTFRSTICQAKSPVKTLDELRIEAIEIPYGTEYRFHIRARSFLHNQVRSFVGSLAQVGSGSWVPADMKKALEARTRPACGPVAPPHGLYLTKVCYPVDPFAD